MVSSLSSDEFRARFGHIAYDDQSHAEDDELTSAAARVFAVIPGTGRYQSMARTALEEVVVWGRKAIRDRQLEREKPTTKTPFDDDGIFNGLP